MNPLRELVVNNDIRPLIAALVPFVDGWTTSTSGFLIKNLGLFKFFAFVISVLLFVGIIYVVRGSVREAKKLRALTFKDLLGLGPTLKPRSLKAWQTILKRLESKEEGQLKLAVIEADRLFDHLLIMVGYRGKNFEDRFKCLTSSQFSNLHDLERVHKIVERLLTEPDTQITFEGASEIINVYRLAFEEMGLIDPLG